jgi:hypothetical protein
VNTVEGNFTGMQASFVNIVGGNFNGLQAGLVNANAGETKGFQTGFVNANIGETRGFQTGFINIAVKGIKGVQVGFVNYADSIEGIPVGFLSIVRKGGYHTVEYSFSEFHPVTVGLKLGVEKFYTNILTAYNSVGEGGRGRFAGGLGFGSILNFNNFFFFNPELNVLTNTGWETLPFDRQFTSLISFFGINLGRYFSITAGPSLTWVRCYNIYTRNNDIQMPKPVFSLYSYDFNDIYERNGIVIGARAALRMRF